MEVQISRCASSCKDSGGDSIGKCSYISNGTSKFWLGKTNKKLNSYELFSTDMMASIRSGDITCTIYSGDHDSIMKNKANLLFSTKNNRNELQEDAMETNGIRQNLQSPEYVKRTAKLFESVKGTEPEPEMKNGLDKKRTETEREDFTLGNLSIDGVDGELNKKPSYLGVSCSNSGYRNVINYDSKLREGFHSAHSNRESLVLCNSRLREASPLRRDVEFIYRNGGGNLGENREPGIFKVTVDREESATSTTTANGVSQTKKFVNISTSTKTISTFRNSKDLENSSKDETNGAKTNGETNVNLKQILNGKGDIGNGVHRRGYSNLGFSPKILKSPEKNCNSFLKSISSFENNSRKWQQTTTTTTKASFNHSKGEQTILDTTNSIQQRIERLYGPGALAQGFYTQKTKPAERGDSSLVSESETVETLPRPQTNGVQISLSALTKPAAPPKTSLTPATMATAAAPTHSTSNGSSLPINPATAVDEKPEPSPEVSTEKVKESQEEDVKSSEEKNGLYFLKLLKKETDRLERLASLAENELENGENLPEEVNGKLRAAAGKARLLVSQKLHQFEGLCQKNMNEKPGEPFPTTSEDLAGFWDMVMLQVVQVYGVFDELEELKKNDWKVATPKPDTVASPATNGQTAVGKTTPKKSTPTSASAKEKSSEKAEAAKKAREETRRKMLEERRRKMKELKENKVVGTDGDGVEIFAK